MWRNTTLFVFPSVRLNLIILRPGRPGRGVGLLRVSSNLFDSAARDVSESRNDLVILRPAAQHHYGPHGFMTEGVVNASTV